MEKKLVYIPSRDRALSWARLALLQENYVEAKSGLEFYCELGIAHFTRVYTKKDKIVTITIDGQQFQLTKLEDAYEANAFSWSKLFDASLILNNSTFLKQLSSLPIWELKNNDEPFYSNLAAYKNIIREGNYSGRFEWLFKLKEEVESDTGIMVNDSGSANFFVEGRSTRLKTLEMPLVELYELIAASKQDEFNIKLLEFQNQVKSYIVSNKLEDDQKFWIDFPSLAVCSHAKSKGFDIKVESEYLPLTFYSE